MRLAVPTLAVAALIATMGSASACTCRNPYARELSFDLSKDQRAQWLAEAGTVVRGRIVSVRKPWWWSRDNTVSATLHVTAVLKGDMPAADLTLLTGSGGGDCGFGADFETMAGTSREVSLEVRPVKDDPRESGAYGVGLCLYNDFTNANGK